MTVRCNCDEVGPLGCCFNDHGESACDPIRCPVSNRDRPKIVVYHDGRTFQYQSDSGRLTGNCFSACVASILNVSLTRLPVLEPLPSVEEDDADLTWYHAHNDWLRPFGLELLSFPYRNDGWFPNGYSILLCRPGGVPHAVVAKNGTPIWNPMPYSGETVGNIVPFEHWVIFQTLDPLARGVS
jgi:hypothetical protein